MRRIALVDFDGVVLRNSQAQKFIHQRVDTFMQRQFPHVPKDVVKSLNTELYQGHGHTFLGLKKLGVDIRLRDFNDYLYGELDTSLSFTEEERTAWDRFYNKMNEKSIEVFMFSNANKAWCQHFIQFKNYDVKYVEDEWHFFHNTIRETLLKPEKTIYDFIHRQFPNTRIYYWEDKLINFQHCMQDERWMKLWVQPNCSQPVEISKNLWATPSIDVIPWD